MGVFNFKQFSVDDSGCGMKISSDSVLLAAWFLPPHGSARTLVDIGAGSGVLALAGAQICTDAAVTALELEANAAYAAAKNFEASPWSGRLRLIEGDFARYTPREPVDLIISNPPYFTCGERSADASRAAARHQSDGLTYRSLLEKSALWLARDGHVGFISPAEFENDIIYCAEMLHLKLRRLARVHTTHNAPSSRLLCDFSLCDGAASTESIYLRNADGTFTTDYLALVEPFYVKI